MRLTEAQVEALRAALLSSFPSYEALDRFASDEKLVKISLEANVGHKGADLETVVFELLNHVKSEQDEGGLARVLQAAHVRRPEHAGLTNLARAAGIARLAAAAELLHPRSFDLRKLEAIWDKELLRPGKRLIVFALCGAEQGVVTNVAERLRVEVGQPSSTSSPLRLLDPKLANAAIQTTELIARLKPKLAKHGIVCVLNADTAADETVDRLLGEVQLQFAGNLSRHLVLLLNLCPQAKLPERCIQLPLPEFEDTDLFRWATAVTEGKDWPEELRDKFKTWLYLQVGSAAMPPADVAYFALESAIDVLRQNLSVAELDQCFTV